MATQALWRGGKKCVRMEVGPECREKEGKVQKMSSNLPYVDTLKEHRPPNEVISLTLSSNNDNAL